MKNNKKKLTTFVVVVGILLVTLIAVFFIAGTSKKQPGERTAKSGGFSEINSQTAAVRTVIAENTTLTDFVYTNGEVETQKSIEVFPSIGGRVIEMHVSLGSPVKAGDIIAYIDPSEPGSYYAKSPVIAPIEGSIISSPVKTGQKVSINSVITKIGDINNLQVTAKVPERYVADLKIGLKAEITLQAYSDTKFIASVVRISPVLDSATRTKEIILNFDKDYPEVNAGMFAKVKLYTVSYTGFPAIQQDAFVQNSDDFYLFVVNQDNTVSKRKVTLGKNIDGYYQVIDGISSGEKIVIEGMISLFEGAKVRDVDQPVSEDDEKTAGSDMKSQKGSIKE